VGVTTVAETEVSQQQRLSGSIQAYTEAPIAFLTSGQITELDVEIGDRVTKGQVVARLSAREQQADVDAAKAGLAAAELQLTLAKATLDRQQTLMDQGLATQAAFDSASTAWETARNSRDSAQAQLNLALETLGYTELHARADGVVTQKHYEVNEVAAAGAPVYQIAEDGPRKVALNIDEVAIAEWPRDREIDVTLISDPKVTAKGKVTEVAPALDATGTVAVKLTLAPEAMLPLGASVTATLAWPAAKAIVLPASALWQTGGKAALWVVDGDNKVSTVPIEIASYGTSNLVVKAGIAVGQRVVVEGAQFLSPGQKVATMEVTSP
jgi:RND family efflux transporter MFP subunit